MGLGEESSAGALAAQAHPSDETDVVGGNIDQGGYSTCQESKGWDTSAFTPKT